MIVKLNTIKPEIKERVLLLYLNRMKFYFTIKTLKWFLLFRSDDYDLEDIQNLVDLIKKRAKQLYEIDVVLFDKVE